MTRRVAALAAMTLAMCSGVSSGQGYRLRLDTRVQSVAYRGSVLDSALASDTITGPTGGPVTPSGFAVSCGSLATYCHFFRPGPVVRAAPATTTADVTMWGLGISGLSVRASARVTGDFRGTDNWPGSDSRLQLLEGYAEYAAGNYVAQLGRQLMATRLGYSGFDGARVSLHDLGRGLDVVGYAGWGLARGVALPVTSPALNPLNEFRPQDRQIVAGAGLGWSTGRMTVRGNYLREVDPGVSQLVSERAGVDVVSVLASRLQLTGGADYDMAAGLWGNAESQLSFARADRRLDASVGVQRYRPHFDLWTIWGAFSPVPYNAVHGSLSVAPAPRLRVRARAQAYEFDDAEVSTPLVDYESSGWRFSWGATYAFSPHWGVDAGYHAEFGPGAASRGLEGAVSLMPTDSLTLILFASSLTRPLEFRFSHAELASYGASARYDASSRLRLQVEASTFAESRQRPDAAAFDWNQVRVSARVTILLGSSADLSGLPPAIQRMPGERERR
jgi:hypothetical protein